MLEKFQAVVIGGGPGGYVCAIRLAQLGLKTACIESRGSLGGTCLNVGCIPSKAFLHAAKILDDSKDAEVSGIVFKEPEINLSKMKEWKNNIIGGLTGGLSGLAKQRGVDVIHGTAKFSSKNEIEVNHESDSQRISSNQFIIAVGSEPAELSFLPDDPRIIDSTGALEPDQIPNDILIIGGGIIGLEMATIYSALGSEVTIVELTKQLMPGTDPDLVRPLERILNKKCKKIMKSSQVISASASDEGISVSFKKDDEEFSEIFQNVLVAVGRKSNGSLLGLDEIGVNVDERGIIDVDKQFRTTVESIFAIGDVIERCPYLVIDDDDLQEINRLNDYLFTSPDNKDDYLCVLGCGMIYNHGSPPNAEWQIDDDNRFICFTATSVIRSGEEILHDYGSEYWDSRR